MKNIVRSSTRKMYGRHTQPWETKLHESCSKEIYDPPNPKYMLGTQPYVSPSVLIITHVLLQEINVELIE